MSIRDGLAKWAGTLCPRDDLVYNGDSMGTVTNITRTKFAVGELIQHKLFEYRGVIADVDRNFQASEEWYQAVAKSRPPKDKPWYHVLVHGSDHTTYVAERNLEADDSVDPVEHPLIEQFFDRFDNGKYSRRGSNN